MADLPGLNSGPSRIPSGVQIIIIIIICKYVNFFRTAVTSLKQVALIRSYECMFMV
jgi:hypothetical protein